MMSECVHLRGHSSPETFDDDLLKPPDRVRAQKAKEYAIKARWKEGDNKNASSLSYEQGEHWREEDEKTLLWDCQCSS